MPSSRRPSFVGDPPTAVVAGHDHGLDAVQARARRTRSAASSTTASGDVAVARVVLVDPVADERRLERTALHGAEAHLADELAAAQEDAEAVGAVERALALPRAAAGPERLTIGDGIGAAGIGERLPLLEPPPAAGAHRAPLLPVVARADPAARPGVQ